MVTEKQRISLDVKVEQQVLLLIERVCALSDIQINVFRKGVSHMCTYLLTSLVPGGNV